MSYGYDKEPQDTLGGDYSRLQGVLTEAFEQAAGGKGRERHANGRRFEKQPILEISRMVGMGFTAGQIMKKAQEATGMAMRGQIRSAQRELLGVIVYAAATHILLSELPEHDTPQDMFPQPSAEQALHRTKI